jgi:FkbM family methyltransferase
MIKRIIKKLKKTKAYPLLKKIYVPNGIKKKIFNFKGEFIVRTNEGIEFKLYNNPFHLETEIYWQGIDNFEWEIETRKIWNKLSMHSGSIFDIGSNTGVFAVLAKAYNSNAKVFAFEPQPNIFSVLCKNNIINNYNIVCENLALSNTKGELPFFNYGNNAFSENSTAGSLNPNWRSKNQKSINVDVDTLDNYIFNNKIEKIDLMKIDVESTEVEVLLGFKENLKKHNPFIIIEIINNELGKSIENILERENYKYYNIDEKRGIQVVENLGLSEYNNYLICPIVRLSELNKIISNS